MQSAIGPVGITQGDLKKFNNDIASLKQEVKNIQGDEMSEFSVITDESELESRENRLDLRISTATFEKVSIARILGGKELIPSQVRTFLTVDFYNHDSKHTD
jgi:hypothetical protein